MKGDVFTDVEQPFATSNTAPLDAIWGAAGHVAREYGDYGYTLGIQATGIGQYLFAVRHSDGSEFFLLSDRYGNVERAEFDGSSWKRARGAVA